MATELQPKKLPEAIRILPRYPVNLGWYTIGDGHIYRRDGSGSVRARYTAVSGKETVIRLHRLVAVEAELRLVLTEPTKRPEWMMDVELHIQRKGE